VYLQQQYPPFWPEGRHSKKYGPVFTIDHISHNHYANIKTWLFRINKKVRWRHHHALHLPNTDYRWYITILHCIVSYVCRSYRSLNSWPAWKRHRERSNYFSLLVGRWATGCPPLPTLWLNLWTWSRGGDKGLTTDQSWSYHSECYYILVQFIYSDIKK